MTEAASPQENTQIRTIGALAHQLRVPMQEVAEIYQSEFDRLALAARIPTYLSVLALSNTRSILRGGARSATLR